MQMFPSKRTICLAAVILGLLLCGCDDDERTIELELQSLAGADSVMAGEALQVRFGYMADTGRPFSFHRWEAIDDSTIALRVFLERDGDDELIGAPALPTLGAVELLAAPTGPFRIVAGELVLDVFGGAASPRGNRLTIELQEEGRPVPGLSLRLSMSGSSSEIELPPTDSRGMVTLLDACETASGMFWINSAPDESHRVSTAAWWPPSCEQPQRLVTSVVSQRTF